MRRIFLKLEGFVNSVDRDADALLENDAVVGQAPNGGFDYFFGIDVLEIDPDFGMFQIAKQQCALKLGIPEFLGILV